MTFHWWLVQNWGESCYYVNYVIKSSIITLISDTNFMMTLCDSAWHTNVNSATHFAIEWNA